MNLTGNVSMNPGPSPRIELYKALLAAKRALPGRGKVHKSAKNEHNKYFYAGHEQVLEAVRETMLEHGLMIEQRTCDFVSVLEGGKIALWQGTHVLCHEGGAEQLYSFTATTLISDKAAYQASTALDRTAHLRIMGLAGSNDDPNYGHPDIEHDSNNDPSTGETPASRAGALPEQKTPGVATLKGFLDELPKIDNRQNLVGWVANVQSWQPKMIDKTPLWTALSAFCEKNNVNRGEVVAAATTLSKGKVK